MRGYDNKSTNRQAGKSVSKIIVKKKKKKVRSVMPIKVDKKKLVVKKIKKSINIS